MQWQNFILLPAVGAAIGAVTNRIALRMLFRPYKPIFLGRFRLPFTPGVIPANRTTLATKIARTFEEKLFSGEDLHKVITGPRIRAIIERRVDDFFARLGPLSSMLSPFKAQIAGRFLETLEETGREALAAGGEFDIARKIEQRIDALDKEQLEAMILEIADRQLRHITWFGGILGAGVGLVQAVLMTLLK